jgi:hypothetical protein
MRTPWELARSTGIITPADLAAFRLWTIKGASKNRPLPRPRPRPLRDPNQMAQEEHRRQRFVPITFKYCSYRPYPGCPKQPTWTWTWSWTWTSFYINEGLHYAPRVSLSISAGRPRNPGKVRLRLPFRQSRENSLHIRKPGVRDRIRNPAAVSCEYTAPSEFWLLQFMEDLWEGGEFAPFI